MTNKITTLLMVRCQSHSQRMAAMVRMANLSSVSCLSGDILSSQEPGPLCCAVFIFLDQ